MRVFLSWSGQRSQAVAELLDRWLKCVIQAIHPWMSSKDIDRGSLWFSEITDQLQTTSVGIICLTKENKVKPWILFEAGALAKGLTSSRICTFLIDLQPSEVTNPLAQFNHTLPNKDNMWELVRTLNTALKDGALKEDILDRVFETYWPQFEEEFRSIIKITPEQTTKESRSQDEILAEILDATRALDKRLTSIESRREILPNGREETSMTRKFSKSFIGDDFTGLGDARILFEKNKILNEKINKGEKAWSIIKTTPEDSPNDQDS